VRSLTNPVTPTPSPSPSPAPAPSPAPKPDAAKPTPAANPPAKPAPADAAKKSDVAVPKNARTPEELNRQADEYIKLGYYDLALSAHLQAACLNHNADTLAKQTSALLQARQASALDYFQAMLEHFPEHAEMQNLIRLRVAFPQTRDHGWGFASFFAPNLADASLAGEEAFRRVATASSVKPEDRLRAEVGALDCRYRAAAHTPELREEARRIYGAILARPDVPKYIADELRKRTAALDTEWNDPNVVRKDEGPK
jgi:tetratricopeptide (TPR) repeat protein